MERLLATKYTKKMKLTSLGGDSKSRGDSRYTIDIGLMKRGSWAPALVAAVIADVALEEWRYMNLLSERTTVNFSDRQATSRGLFTSNYGFSKLGPSLNLGKAVTISFNGKKSRTMQL